MVTSVLNLMHWRGEVGFCTRMVYKTYPRGTPPGKSMISDFLISREWERSPQATRSVCLGPASQENIENPLLVLVLWDYSFTSPACGCHQGPSLLPKPWKSPRPPMLGLQAHPPYWHQLPFGVFQRRKYDCFNTSKPNLIFCTCHTLNLWQQKRLCTGFYRN